MKKLVLCVGILSGIALGTAQAAEPPAGHAMAAKAPAVKAEQPTCGQMISSMAPIPAKISEGAASVADMMEAHAALMGKDKDSAVEAKGMRGIAKTHRAISASLLKASEEMKKAASWPAAPHDMAKMMADPKMAEANKKMIEVHKELIAMFQKMVADMEAQNKQMMK
ncbi:MAG TPA: hypothetical protein VF550_04950 [Polyangia bacterium]